MLLSKLQKDDVLSRRTVDLQSFFDSELRDLNAVTLDSCSSVRLGSSHSDSCFFSFVSTGH